jgi:hypothetical protein
MYIGIFSVIFLGFKSAILTLAFSSHGDTETRSFYYGIPLKTSVSQCLCGQLFFKVRTAGFKLVLLCSLVSEIREC